MAPASYNTVFPRRITGDPWSARGISEKSYQVDTPEPNRSASGPNGP
ncbi:hypothetical protein ICC18_33260 [Paenibacillus sp. WST5]|uniref:Uncharacterized protein n=1 Tax=Paenibacillus sedimenti TaxID=2770274 RepID=A0A926QNZ4_9BACL|nr:hypothetical protein [Paenibacillus sedimenti]